MQQSLRLRPSTSLCVKQAFVDDPRDSEENVLETDLRANDMHRNWSSLDHGPRVLTYSVHVISTDSPCHYYLTTQAVMCLLEHDRQL